MAQGASSRAWYRSDEQMAKMLDRQGGSCPMCARPIAAGDKTSVDRIVPGAQGGRYEDDNIQLTHHVCNQRANAKKSISNLMKLLR